MNPFVIQSLSSNKDYQFRNTPPMKFSPFMQNGYFSSVGRSNMLRYSYYTVGPYGVLQQNLKPLPANQPQFVARPIAFLNGINVVPQNFQFRVNVLRGKVMGLAEPQQTQLVIAKNESIGKMLPPPTELKFIGKSFTRSPFGSDTNRKRLLDVFNKNFKLSRPTINGAHDRKRKQIVPGEEMVVQSSCFLLNCNCNKRQKTSCEPRYDTNICLNNPNAMKKNEDQVRFKTVIEEDQDGLLRVCYEPLLGSNESGSRTRVLRSNNNASSVDKDKNPADLDLTLHL